ncbi:MAG: hypothetical protein GY745_22600 [Actinomycetia bacterium]|nr:hypothetical protein [Actinomycetes bacterium]
MNNKPRRGQRFGPEVWAERGEREWSLWDLWFSVVAVLDHDGDLDGLAGVFTESIQRPAFSDGRADEAKLSHLRDLAERLHAAELGVGDLADANAIGDKVIVRRAREKVTGRVSLEHRAMTPAMVDTPRARLRQRARFGHWSEFPSNPEQFYERFRPAVERAGHVSKGKSFSAANRFVERLHDLDGPRRTVTDRLALYRAFHTAGLALADNTSDSYGVLGEARTEAWLTYLGIDWRSTGIDPAVYWRDLCELKIWEPYAVDYDNTTAWFASAASDEVDLIESILVDLESEHRGVVLGWEADEAFQALPDLYIATGTHDRFVGAAERLGSGWWQLIEAMATTLVDSGRRDEALAVFAAADQPGMHRDYLRGRCQAICGATPR